MNETHQAANSPGRPAIRRRPDGSIDPAGEAGWFLQRERERRDLDLVIVSQLLGIHESHLAGIESGDLTRLPSRDEALHMIGIYGRYLGFQPEPLIQHYSGFLPLLVAAQRRKGGIAKPLSSAKIIPFSSAVKLAMSSRGLKIVSSIAGVALMLTAAAAVLSPKQEEQIAQGVDPLPTATVQKKADDGSSVRVKESPLADDHVATPLEAGEGSMAAARPQNELGDLGAFIRRQLEEPTGDLKVPAPATTNGSESLAPVPVNPAGLGAEARVVLKATGASVWFRLEDTRGNVVISRTLRRGESYGVPHRDDLMIIARDGGSISYEIDGVDQGPLGTPGEIVVGRPLSVAKLLNQRG